MRAVGYQTSLPIDDPLSLQDIELPRPEAKGHDLLVRVGAVSVNPVDTKVRKRAQPEAGQWKVLGWDAVGTVEAVGPEASRFRPGDEVFYAGALGRQGTDAEYHLVDERIVGRKPASLTVAEAAALPLTAITAWEALFDRLEVKRPVPGVANAILIVGGAGGVGSIATQLARRLTDLTVITTASRPETAAWSRELGAHHVVDHREDIPAQLKALGVKPRYVFSTNTTARNWEQIVASIAPQGAIVLIESQAPIDARQLMPKSVSLHWELMFTRPIFGTPDMIEQHHLLNAVADMVDHGRIRHTMTLNLGPMTAARLREAHAKVESGTMIGKVVLEGL